MDLIEHCNACWETGEFPLKQSEIIYSPAEETGLENETW